jgi:U4/U6.U5 tri-snRNP-associated protein 1
MDAISIEETNRLRVSLGMKPLPVPGATGPTFKDAASTPEEDPGSTLETREAASYDNYRKVREDEEAKRKREAKAEAIKKARDAAKRFAQLEGKGLGDADDDADLDAKRWLIKQKKRQREIEKARMLEQEHAEAEAAAAAAAQYTAKDLAGVKVGHELDTFEDGEEQVLVLKDTTIDENEDEGDELEALELRDKEKLKEKLELKKKKPVYNPNDIDDTGERKILAQYDEEIDGKKRSRFTLDGEGTTVEQREAMRNGTLDKNKPKVFSLDILKDEPTSDYLDISEVKIKKPKKKKSKLTRQRPVDEDDMFPTMEAAEPVRDADTKMDLDTPAVPSKKRSFEDSTFGDDDDLQASLTRTRVETLKKRKRVRPEDLARQIREEASQPPEDDIEEGGLVVDETSEFVANLQKPEPVAPKNDRRKSTSRQPDAVTAMGADSGDEDGDVQMSYAELEEEEDRKKRATSSVPPEGPSTGIDEEATIDKGMGATLKLLRERGILKSDTSSDPAAIFASKQKFLAEKRRREEAAELKARRQREHDRATGRLERMSAREKEEYARQQNTYRDQAESRQLADHFNKEYKPNVELKYVDDFGRHMNAKEAFKHLSHQFHGKGSGKQKTEKMLKKIEDEKRREAKSALDASGEVVGGMTRAMGEQLKRTKQAGVRLA